MQIGCRWLCPFSQKPYIGLGWKLPSLFIFVLCTSCPNITRVQRTNCNICPFQFPHFCRWTWIKMCCSWNSWTNISQNIELGWAEIFQPSNYHSNPSPHKKLEKPTSWIVRKLQIGCRWWWSFSWKLCTRLS